MPPLSYTYRVEQVSHGGHGRPKFVVLREQLQYLLERDFSVPDVAQHLGLSLRTTERRLHEFGITSGQFFTTIDNETLDRTVKMMVNKIDRPNTTPTVRGICTFAVYFRFFDLFVASLLFMKGTSYCVLRRK